MIYVVGIGPGDQRAITLEALEALKEADVIVGYKTYIDLIKTYEVLAEDFHTKTLVQNGMRGEVARCQEALALATKGYCVAVVSSGDAGVYGMAGLVLELVEKQIQAGGEAIDVKVIPGVTASSAAAAVLGAPLMHDYCHISLSDLLTPLETIHKRLRHAALADFVICLYNPRSKGRPDHLAQALSIVKAAAGKDLPVAVVKDAYRPNQRIERTSLKYLETQKVDMTSILIIGNATTYHLDHATITPRGYEAKGLRSEGGLG